MSLIEKLTVREMVLIALMAAVICITAPLSIPIGPVPISLANLVICFCVIILGKKSATLSVIIYILLGLIGLPVFSNFRGGFSVLAGPTGGYIIGYIFLAYISGIFVEKFQDSSIMYFIGMILGTAALYAFGTSWFCTVSGMPLDKALKICVIPFLMLDSIKIIIAVIFAPKLKKLVIKAI